MLGKRLCIDFNNQMAITNGIYYFEYQCFIPRLVLDALTEIARILTNLIEMSYNVETAAFYHLQCLAVEQPYNRFDVVIEIFRHLRTKRLKAGICIDKLTPEQSKYLYGNYQDIGS